MQNKDKKSKQLKRFKYAQTEKIKQENQLAKTSQQNQIAELANYIYNNICDDYNNIYKEHSPHKYLANKSLFFDISKYNIKVINSVDADKKLNYRIQTHKCYFVDGFWLVIPIYNKYKKDIRNLQFIDNVGNKREIYAIETIKKYGGKYIIPPNEIKDFCDFYTITYRQKHSKKQTINIMKNYIKKLLDKM